jgi:hypothetical protein
MSLPTLSRSPRPHSRLLKLGEQQTSTYDVTIRQQFFYKAPLR